MTFFSPGNTFALTSSVSQKGRAIKSLFNFAVGAHPQPGLSRNTRDFLGPRVPRVTEACRAVGSSYVCAMFA
ncbi:hypothetical protein COCMIDRAFT_82644 [Bipolaris oryzae ATCC 44560]|uniref:Uncharacterized protein n=1 Tax=Bipolaris oryzae ATCC 44560 TaxID=930090 RepID=W6ZJC2_COCMI|nr:uncharacterized protein COCMIDRAFT_82644 [Bipolaris oryzae ATCC 44560]EUC50145.1 hypothetical protein COCMIDRAFT_82644 [Bipolaris oryzae ATCC 44560]